VGNLVKKKKKISRKSSKRRKVEVKPKSNFVFKLKLAFVFIVIIAVIGTILFSIKLPYNAVETYSELVPYEDVEIFTESEVREDCESRPYQYNAEWDSLESGDDKEGYMVNRVKIENLENIAGEFELVIYYYDVSIHPLEYKSTFTYEDADLISTKRLVKIDANSEISRLVSTRIENIGTAYWSRFKVTPPVLQDCDQTLVPIERARTITKYEEVEKTRNITKYANPIELLLMKLGFKRAD
jgi:hypothetical protein